ncbi:MAG: DUF1906 domain-containing protein [Ardenticatenales bacterium]|nr:DUF1906 domain-containing protein [Ardenticatenales bacterium]
MNSTPRKRSLLLFWLILFAFPLFLAGRAASAQSDEIRQAEADVPFPDAARAPNLAPYTPTGWDYPIVPASVSGTNTVNTLYAGQTTYIDWAVVNNGNQSAWDQFSVCVYLDGSQIGSWSVRRLRRNYYTYLEDWTYTVNSSGNHTLRIVVDCTNVVAESNENDNVWEHTFYWQGGGGNPGGIVISNQQGFDKCEIPSTSQMQTWWNSSPYYEINLYIGGSARACANSGLNAAWVSTVSNQGWNFIPTWVGPQAPCSGFSSRFSSDPATAYSQGRSEANSAYNVATNLGLIGQGRNTIIYYDLEAYPGDANCREAAKSFISGWSGRLQELGQRAGAYGSACGTYVTDWASAGNVPDDVWLAHWIYSGYNANATVWNVACVSDGYWSNHQRLRQYAGGHNETWGGVTFNIDSNAEDGHVAGVNPRAMSPVQLAQTGVSARDMRLLNERQGWLLTDGKLLWTEDAGISWTNITPAGIDPAAIQSVAFSDVRHGWVAVPTALNALAVFATVDGGQTWQQHDLTLFAPDSGQAAAQVHLDFVSTQVGYLAVTLSSGVNFSQGLLFQTGDGGQTWQQRTLPLGAAVRFSSPTTGWTVGGPAGDALYRTRDGGRFWTRLTLTDAAVSFAALPTFVDEMNGWLPITIADGDQSRVRLYATMDGGATWTLARTLPLVVEPTGHVPVHLVDGVMRLSDDAAPTGAGQATWQGKTGWVQTAVSQCSGEKGVAPLRCVTTSNLWWSVDAGITWTPMTLPNE